MVNVGSLGIETNFDLNHYMAIISIYEGEGPVSERVKVETIQQSW